MTTLFGDDPVIITHDGEQLRSIQFWAQTRSPFAPGLRWEEVTSITSHGKHQPSLRIQPDCPEEWLPAVWAAFTDLRQGRMRTATHTVIHGRFGEPTFTADIQEVRS